ncbi:MAG TPA: response regulator [Pyrinomonadaceae bacterium]|jgi:CheY-like chemotaxis protein
MNLAERTASRTASGEARQDECSCLQGKFHNELAGFLRNLGTEQERKDYLEHALVEYAAAGRHFEQAGDVRCKAFVESNLASLLFTLGRFAEAHEHLEDARSLFAGLEDRTNAARADNLRARVLLAEGRGGEAEKLAQAAVEALERAGEGALLAEALTTRGTILAHLGRYRQALSAFERASEAAEGAGDFERAGAAALSVIEELGDRLHFGKLCKVYVEADRLLSKSQEISLLKRLNLCAGWVLRMVAGSPSLASFPLYRRAQEEGAAFAEASTEGCDAGEEKEATWEEFCLKEEVRRYEARVIERALRETDGVVSKASHLLGFRHHNSLIALLNTRHKNLLYARSPIIPRRRSIIREPLEPKSASSPARAGKSVRRVVILHVEDNPLAASTVKERLEAEGWKVLTCAGGAAGLKLIESSAHYDLLLLDNELPGIGGLELVRRARRLPHRASIPIAILSGSDCVMEAHRAGANLFLRKPEDIPALVETIEHLLRMKTETS